MRCDVARKVIKLSNSCADTIWCHDSVPEYKAAVASLLMGTAACESNLHYRRQGGFSWNPDPVHAEDIRGAWGLWQTELAAVRDSLRFVKARRLLDLKCGEWLFQVHGADMSTIAMLPDLALVQLIGGWDRLACLFARLHYLRVPAPVPDNHASRADYYKRWYNTPLGAGTPDKYLTDFATYIEPYLET